LITAPAAQQLIVSFGPLKTLAILGVAYFVMVMLGSSIMRNPPEGWRPKGWQPSAKQQEQLEARDYTLKEALSTWQWYVLWAMLFLNVTAGISIISQASPMAQEISGVNAAIAAGMVGLISIANGIGRLVWAWLSDAIGRRNVFLIMFLIQAVLFFILPSQHEFTMLAAICFIVISCYGGGFGTMPAFAADFFGPKWVGSIYGLMLTAWGFAGVFGPLLIAAIRQSTGRYDQALIVIALIMLVSSVLPLIVRAQRTERQPIGARARS
jgi:MFS transporter, OFA family, oxalate/formate antiporter